MYLCGSVRLVSADVSCFLPYKGGSKLHLVLFIGPAVFTSSVIFCDDADIYPLWFLLVSPDASCVDFSLTVCVSDSSKYACGTKTCTSPLFFKTEKHSYPVPTHFSTLQPTDESVIWCRSYSAKGTVYLIKVWHEGSYKTLPLISGNNTITLYD